MKTKIVFVLVCLIYSYSQAQEKPKEKETFKLPVFGIGIKSLNLLSESNQNSDLLPGNRIIIPVNVTKNFRLQPEFGYSYESTYREEISDDLESKSNIYGLGAFGMYQKERMNYYAGIKYLISNNNFEYIDNGYNPNPPYNSYYSKETVEYTYSIFGFHIGGEYFFGKHFSAGIEVGFQDVNLTSEEIQGEEIKTYFFNTETNLLVRIYF